MPIEHRLAVQRLAIDYVPERLTFQKFHCDEGSAIDLVDFVDRANVGVIQGGRGFSLPMEAAQRLMVPGHIVGQKFQGNETIQFDVLSLVNHTHPAAPKLLDDTIVRNGLADHSLECYGG